MPDRLGNPSGKLTRIERVQKPLRRLLRSLRQFEEPEYALVIGFGWCFGIDRDVWNSGTGKNVFGRRSFRCDRENRPANPDIVEKFGRNLELRIVRIGYVQDKQKIRLFTDAQSFLPGNISVPNLNNAGRAQLFEVLRAGQGTEIV